MEINQGHTAIYDDPESYNARTIDLEPAPFSQPQSQPFEHEKILHGNTEATDSVDKSNIMQVFENHLCFPNARIAADPNERYWPLEDLKHLMKQRVPLWLREEKDGSIDS
ncbi:hypothetical protein BJX63DRAFT_158742 [Aspergillus granulosus]|uniref:Uncharacterized protein n=1 Tax=Aspergillus granulosus TaxID=176169 RepID=A0ABR4HIZ9_9EURO